MVYFSDKKYGQLDPLQMIGLSGSAYRVAPSGIWTLLGGFASGRSFPDADGWHDYCGNPAPPNALCLFKDPDGETWIGYGGNLDPCFNVAYLKWKYTGIAREERGLWGR